jgi:Flp pilus assembly protein TadD
MKNLIRYIDNRFFSSVYQVRRITILVAILLVAALISFAGYYYYDRYYTTEIPIAERSIAEAEKAVRDDPGNPDTRLMLAETYMLYSRFDDAVELASQVQQEYPENLAADFILGISHANNGNPDLALEPLQKFIDSRKDEEMPGLDKQLQAAAYYLGDSYLQLGQPELAILPLENAVNWSQTDADSMFKLGIAYAEIEEHYKAVNMFHAATTFVPDYLEAYEAMAESYSALNVPELVDYARGMTAYANKDYQKAVELLQRSVEGKSDFAPAYAGLGRSYESLGDLQNAKSSFESALKIDINNFTASVGLQRVDAALKK